jgi:hypothetical protein
MTSKMNRAKTARRAGALIAIGFVLVSQCVKNIAERRKKMAKVLRSIKFLTKLKDTCNDPSVGGRHLDYINERLTKFEAEEFVAHVTKCTFCFKSIKDLTFFAELENECADPSIGKKHFDYINNRMSRPEAEKFIAHAGKCMFCYDALIKWHYEKVVSDQNSWWAPAQNNLLSNTNINIAAFSTNTFPAPVIVAVETGDIFWEN